MTMLIVSHEMGFVREVASKVVMMDKGQVVEEGRRERSSTRRRPSARASSSARSCGTEARGRRSRHVPERGELPEIHRGLAAHDQLGRHQCRDRAGGESHQGNMFMKKPGSPGTSPRIGFQSAVPLTMAGQTRSMRAEPRRGTTRLGDAQVGAQRFRLTTGRSPTPRSSAPASRRRSGAEPLRACFERELLAGEIDEMLDEAVRPAR